MDLLQLEHFLAVAEELSFTRAAERVHLYTAGRQSKCEKARGSGRCNTVRARHAGPYADRSR